MLKGDKKMNSKQFNQVLEMLIIIAQETNNLNKVIEYIKQIQQKE